MKSQLWLVTNKHLPIPEVTEDIILTEYLKEVFDIEVIDVLDPEIDQYGIKNFLVIGNIWSDVDTIEQLHEFETKASENLNKIYKKPFRTYNMPNNREWNKLYLTDLFNKWLPVIPSISSISELWYLENHDDFFIKPLQSWDGIGSYRTTKAELLKAHPENMIIQPFYNFIAEVSFFMIDSECIYALRTQTSSSRWKLSEFTPNDFQKSFAEKFTTQRPDRWYQRIDAIELKNGDLLLTEMEGNGAYKSFSQISKNTQKKFASALIRSLKIHVF